MKRFLIITAVLTGLLLPPATRLQAFPPAPHHLVFGTLRDEFGNPLTHGVSIVLEAASGARAVGVARENLRPGVNYEIKVLMDAGLTDRAYRPTALEPAAPFRIKVRIGNREYLPIEMRGDAAALGQAGKRTRIDLTLGEDSDNDGLPDAWERALIAAGKGDSLADIRPDGDSDGDGMKNRAEYLAGTYAFDDGNGFELQLAGFKAGRPLLDFTVVAGRTYTIQGSADLKSWHPIPFREDGADQFGESRYATEVRPIRVEADISGSKDVKFFKLMAR